ncbi:hypothetical protein HK104_009669 [Borealophlyctis nickersoniae]|nr:hypothetical protein HK104_009669 [Borealophlyctis nickersoniae]
MPQLHNDPVEAQHPHYDNSPSVTDDNQPHPQQQQPSQPQQQQQHDPSSSSSGDDDTPPSSSLCLICKKQDATYAPSVCGHVYLCVACARKQATGGRCKVCRQFFAEVRRV